MCVSDLQWKPAHTEDTLTNMPRHSLYIIIGALCVAFVLMLIILIVGICRISRIEYQGSSRHAYQEFYNCRSIDSEFSNAIASIRHARSVTGFVYEPRFTKLLLKNKGYLSSDITVWYNLPLINCCIK